jgi:hypothetical protein
MAVLRVNSGTERQCLSRIRNKPPGRSPGGLFRNCRHGAGSAAPNGAGPPPFSAAPPDRAVRNARRVGAGQIRPTANDDRIPNDTSNETRALRLMVALQVNSGTLSRPRDRFEHHQLSRGEEIWIPHRRPGLALCREHPVELLQAAGILQLSHPAAYRLLLAEPAPQSFHPSASPLPSSGPDCPLPESSMSARGHGAKR